jgi:hypothetical protein
VAVVQAVRTPTPSKVKKRLVLFIEPSAKF